MAIPDDQLETWSHQGATKYASDFCERIRSALHKDPVLQTRQFEVFLQGSYCNHTNIYGTSDVDVVAMLTESYIPEYGALSDEARTLLKEKTIPATYRYDDFRRDVSNAIHNAFPYHKITEGGKSIKIHRTSYNPPADVVPCLEYRLYRQPQTLHDTPSYDEGIWLYDRHRSQSVINFPKQHRENGIDKNKKTSLRYKPTIRIFKNARDWLEENGHIEKDTASSYAIECLLYNVPNYMFCSTHSDTFVQILKWLSATNITPFVCQNGIQTLFDSDCWTVQNAHIYIGKLIEMWSNWR